MVFPEDKEIENGILPVRVGEIYNDKNVLNVKKLLSMITDLEERVEDLESQIRRMNY